MSDIGIDREVVHQPSSNWEPRMKELIRKLDKDYAIGLSEEEIDLIARQAEESARLYQKLYEVATTEENSVSKCDGGEKQ